MLLRSSSTPILQAYTWQLSTPVVDPTRSVSMSLERTSSESELRLFASAKEKMFPACARSSPVIKKEDTSICLKDAAALAEVDEEYYVAGGPGGGVRGGNGGAGGNGWWSSGNDGPNGSQQMEEYYQSMIKLYPGDSLLLANYAKYLKDIKGDNVKAEEVCGRAILANANDGNVLSMYGDLIWKNHKNGDRAQFYFDQAVQSSPDDCYVLASYARFLWAADEDDDSVNEELQIYQNLSQEQIPLIAAT